ncbi:MAG: hypothetical protein EOO45_01305 [Flavobacterium sp.]|nr:MAG: hypothetical protein EOO45_01305 [Flavobacterium sp.]
MDNISHAYVSEPGWECPDHSTYFQDYDIKVWRPSLFRILPPGFPRKYLLFYLAHHLHIFKNRYYSVIYVYDNKNGALVSSTLLIPKYFKWPFMNDGDLQYSYSITKPHYRGKGVNTFVKQYARVLYNERTTNFWGLVDPENISSIKVLEKSGLHFYRTAKRVKNKVLPGYHIELND